MLKGYGIDMREDVTKVLIVCGYGCEMDYDYKRFIEFCTEFIRANDIEIVIACGGSTQKSKNETEAQCIIKAFYSEFESYKMLDKISNKTGFTNPKFIEESSSYTSLENLVNAKECLKKLELDRHNTSIWIACKIEKSLYIRMLIDKIYCKELWYHVWAIAYDNAKPKDAEREFRHLILKYLALKFPPLKKLAHWLKVRKSRKL
jgi:hypothetical protein